jgi:hypothetical protein
MDCPQRQQFSDGEANATESLTPAMMPMLPAEDRFT